MSLFSDNKNKAPQRHCRILVVEDDPAMLSLLSQALSTDEREVQEAVDGADAIACVQKGDPFDLIISDICMPHKDGHEVLWAVREHSPATKVVLITAFGEVEDYLDSMDQGAFDYLNKPVRIGDLQAVVERALA